MEERNGIKRTTYMGNADYIKYLFGDEADEIMQRFNQMIQDFNKKNNTLSTQKDSQEKEE